jgi:3-hydroxyacyl-CoA dehydrogenase
MYGVKHQNNPQAGLEHEAANFAILGASPQHKALTSLFQMFNATKEVRKRTGGGKPTKVDKVGVIGAGVMGWQIAALTIAKNHQVYMRDIKQEFVDKGLKSIKSQIDQKVQRKRLTPEKAKKQFGLIKGGTDIKPFSECQLLVEAAVEVMQLKKKILQELEQSLPENVVFGTNTSSLSITELATVSKRPENVVGIHFFNPVSKMPLVEIIRGAKTSDSTTATAYQYALSLGKIPIVCRDGPGEQLSIQMSRRVRNIIR